MPIRYQQRLAAIAAGAALTLVTSMASAVPFGTFDPRSQAMGGTGVASGTADNAAFYNPALLASMAGEDDFSLVFPNVTARVADKNDFRDDVDTVDAALDRAEAAVSACSTGCADGTAAQAEALAALDQLLNGLNALDQDVIEGEAFTGITVGLPGESLGAALFAGARAIGGATVDVDSADTTEIRTVRREIEDELPPSSNPAQNPQSTASVRGALISEVGLAFARENDAGVAVGLSPKLQRVETFDYQDTVDDVDIDTSQNTTEDSNFNLDAGVTWQMSRTWRVGLTGRDLVSEDYRTVNGRTVSIEPQYRVGIARTGDFLTVAVDYDLQENDPVGALDSRTQFLGAGLELDLLDTLQLRLGYRTNLADQASGSGLADNTADVGSVGLGLDILGLHLDASVMGNGDELGGGLQTGFRF